jgi:nucleotide-binding universal stress UspA family protein
MKTTLFLTDFSEPAYQALHYAVAITRLFRGQLILFHPVTDKLPESPSRVEPQSFADQARTEEQLVKLATQVSTEVPCEYVINIGLTEDEISELIREREVDMLVIGNSLFNQTLDSSVDLVHVLPCPVLIVPEQLFFKQFNKIVFAVDLKPSLQEDTIRPLVKLASLTGAEILVLNVLAGSREIPPAKAAEGIKLESLLETVDYSLHVLRDKNVIAGIENFVEVTRADMLVLIAHKYSFLDMLFHRSTTNEMASRSLVPVLALVE